MLDGGKGHSQKKNHHHSLSHKNDMEHLLPGLYQEGIRSKPPHIKMALNNISSRPLRWDEVSNCKKPLRSENPTPQNPFRSKSLAKNMKAPGFQNGRTNTLNWTSHHTQGREGTPNPIMLITTPSKTQLSSRNKKMMNRPVTLKTSERS